MKRQLVSGDEAVRRKRQHVEPCGDCPWARASLPGWLGSQSADQWLKSAHGEDTIMCHTVSNQQCAGAAIYRRNVCKMARDQEQLRLPADRELVFATSVQFKEHYEKGRN